MEPDLRQHPPQPALMPLAAASWQAMLLFGVLTLILGLVVTIHPSVSLMGLSEIIGALMFRRAAITQQRAALSVVGEVHAGGTPTGSLAG